MADNNDDAFAWRQLRKAACFAPLVKTAARLGQHSVVCKLAEADSQEWSMR